MEVINKIVDSAKRVNKAILELLSIILLLGIICHFFHPIISRLEPAEAKIINIATNSSKPTKYYFEYYTYEGVRIVGSKSSSKSFQGFNLGDNFGVYYHPKLPHWYVRKDIFIASVMLFLTLIASYLASYIKRYTIKYQRI